jgi:hypothetical protein
VVALARYAPADQAAARALSTSLLRINPRAFKPDYNPPKLPKATPAPARPANRKPSTLQVALALVGGSAVLGLLALTAL